MLFAPGIWQLMALGGHRKPDTRISAFGGHADIAKQMPEVRF